MVGTQAPTGTHFAFNHGLAVLLLGAGRGQKAMKSQSLACRSSTVMLAFQQPATLQKGEDELGSEQHEAEPGRKRLGVEKAAFCLESFPGFGGVHGL